MAPQIDCEQIVIHAFHHVTKIENITKVTSLRKKAFSKCLESIKRLDKLAHEFGVKMCIENLNARLHLEKPYYLIFGVSPYDLLEITREVNHNLGLCFDVAHAKNLCNFIKKSKEMQALCGVNELTVENFFEWFQIKWTSFTYLMQRGTLQA